VSADIANVVERMSSTDAEVRLAAVEELTQSAEAAQPAAVPLLRACLDEDERICEAAGAALETIGAPQPEDLNEIAEWLDHSDPNVGYWAATFIGRLGSVAAPGVQALTAALSEQRHAIVRQRAAWALGRIGRGGRLRAGGRSPPERRCGT
jgi:HEAT repeat protein